MLIFESLIYRIGDSGRPKITIELALPQILLIYEKLVSYQKSRVFIDNSRLFSLWLFFGKFKLSITSKSYKISLKVPIFPILSFSWVSPDSDYFYKKCFIFKGFVYFWLKKYRKFLKLIKAVIENSWFWWNFIEK